MARSHRGSRATLRGISVPAAGVSSSRLQSGTRPAERWLKTTSKSANNPLPDRKHPARPNPIPKSIGKGPPCSQNASELPLVRNASQSGSPIDGLLQTLCKVAFSQGKSHSVAVVSGYSNWRTAVILAIEAVIKPWFGSVHFLRTRLYEIHFSVARASTMGST
jgi:hypothetical protein